MFCESITNANPDLSAVADPVTLLQAFLGICWRGNIHMTIKAAVMEQHNISWDNFMNGLWSKQWAKTQDMYYKTKKQQNSGNQWAAKVTTRIWEIKKEMLESLLWSISGK